MLRKFIGCLCLVSMISGGFVHAEPAIPGDDYLCTWKADLKFFKYYHWYAYEFPLRVYIPPIPPFFAVSHPERYLQQVQQAFLNWSAVLPLLRFVWVQDPRQAQIQVQWQEKFPESESTWGRAALPTPYLSKEKKPRIRHKSTLFLALKAQNGTGFMPGETQFSPEEFLAIATHEAGHALGLLHSNAPDDLMYHALFAHFDGKWEISQRDKASIIRLYSLPEELEISPCNG